MSLKMYPCVLFSRVRILDMMKTVFFWIAWGIISFWALKTFYFSYDKGKLQKLRETAFYINLSVLILFLLPWLPLSQGGFSGWELIEQGNPLVSVLVVLVIASFTLFLTKNRNSLKAGAVLHITASMLLIITMIRLTPGTVKLTLGSIAPIIASLLLLIGNVVVLLLWQQLQLETKKK